MALRDRTLTCVDCGKEFVFPVCEQQYHKEMGLETGPEKCGECRAPLKCERLLVRDAAGNTRECFKHACASCGRPAYVSVEPTASNPAYCGDCRARLEGEQESPKDSDRGSPAGRDVGSPPPA